MTIHPSRPEGAQELVMLLETERDAARAGEAAAMVDAARLREETLWTAAALQVVCSQPCVASEADKITIEGEARTVGDILDAVDAALGATTTRPDGPPQ